MAILLIFGQLFGFITIYIMIAFEIITISKLIKDFPIIAMNIDIRKGNEISLVSGQKLTKLELEEIYEYKFKVFNMLPIPIIKF